MASCKDLLTSEAVEVESASHIFFFSSSSPVETTSHDQGTTAIASELSDEMGHLMPELTHSDELWHQMSQLTEALSELAREYSVRSPAALLKLAQC